MNKPFDHPRILTFKLSLYHHIGEPKKRAQMNMSSMSCVSFDAGLDDVSMLTATVTNPSGVEEPCLLKKLPNNRMGNVHNTSLISAKK